MKLDSSRQDLFLSDKVLFSVVARLGRLPQTTKRGHVFRQGVFAWAHISKASFTRRLTCGYKQERGSFTHYLKLLIYQLLSEC